MVSGRAAANRDQLVVVAKCLKSRRSFDARRSASQRRWTTLTETGKQIGRGLAAVVSAFNPKRIYIGGEVTAAWELLEPPIREALVEGTLTEVTASTPVYADPNPG